MRRYFAPALLVFSVFLLSLFFVKSVSAAVLLEEDFQDGSPDGWSVVPIEDFTEPAQEPIDSPWEISNVGGDFRYGKTLYGTGQRSISIPDIDSSDLPKWQNYVFEVDIFPSGGTYDRNLLFRYQDPVHSYGIHLIPPQIRLVRYRTGQPFGEGLAATNQSFGYGPFHIKVEVQDSNIKIFVNSDTPSINFTDNSEYKISQGIIGLYVSTGANHPHTVFFDNIRVTSLELENPQPLILLPGLGGSWNHTEIFTGIDQPQSAWYKTPFLNNYDGLIQTLQNAGYILGDNLFIFYYDWLQPISQTASELSNYINTVVNPPPGTKIDLVGHSLGGLVARTYIQNNPESHPIDQLITLGSPHKGAVQIYQAWEGADLRNLLDPKARIGTGILLRLRGFTYPNQVEAIQNIVPSLGNLLFINDYLKWKNTGIIKPELNMLQQNSWLKSLDTTPELLGLTDTVLGTAGDTPRWLQIIRRSQIDNWLGRWEDGKPVSEESATGDRTVLEESAQLPGSNLTILTGLNHQDLVQSSTGQEKILELLDATPGEIVEQSSPSFEPALVFTVASPATLRITNPLGQRVGFGVDPPEIPNAFFSSSEKIIIVPNATSGSYRIEVISEGGGGTYQLLAGQLTEKGDFWTKYEGEVTPSNPDTYILPFDSTLQTTPTYLAELINAKLKSLLKQIRKQNINPRIRGRSTSKVAVIYGQTRPIPLLINLNKPKMVQTRVERAIGKTVDAIDYMESANPDLTPNLREIQDLLGQLHDFF